MIDVRIDFLLTKRFSVVEQTIFHLVLAGINDVQTIRIMLCIYSDDVLANAIKKLVNHQILCANLENRTLGVSELVLAIMDKCLQCSDTLSLPDNFISGSSNDMLCISDYDTKQQLLDTLLPGLKTGILVKSLDFVLYQRGVQGE